MQPIRILDHREEVLKNGHENGESTVEKWQGRRNDLGNRSLDEETLPILVLQLSE